MLVLPLRVSHLAALAVLSMTLNRTERQLIENGWIIFNEFQNEELLITLRMLSWQHVVIDG